MRISLLIIGFLCASLLAMGQIGIGTDSPSEKAIMHLNSSNKGIIIPKLNSGEMSAMTVGTNKPEQGTLVYNTDSNEIYAYYNAEWYSMTPFKKVFRSKPIHKGRIKLAAKDTVADNHRYVAASVPRGGIIMWSGTVVPEGWRLCDGSNGTPDLRGRFVVGYDSRFTAYNQPGNLSEKGSTGGNLGGLDFVELTNQQMPKHNHGGTTGSVGNHSHGYSDRYLIESANLSNMPSGTLNYAFSTTGKTGNEGLDNNNTHFYYVNSTTVANGGHSHSISNDGGTPSKTADGHENRPPYYVLAYIMRVE